MYNEEGMLALHRQWTKRAWILLAIEIVLLAGVIVLATTRIEWAVTLATCVAGCFAVAYWELLVKPIRKYEQYQAGCLKGRSHEVEVLFQYLEEEPSLVDGVELRAMHCVEPTVDRHNEPKERLFYWDPQIEWPGFQENQRLMVTYHDRALVQVTPMEA